MDLRRISATLLCLFSLTACSGDPHGQSGDIHQQSKIEVIPSPVHNETPEEISKHSPFSEETPEEVQVSERMDIHDYLPEVFPEWCRDDIITWDSYPRAAFTDGNVIIVPDMKLTDLPQSFRDTLTCSERGIYAERPGNLDQRAENALYAVYQTDDLQFTTVYYDPEQSDRYEDAGVEYVREVIALSDTFCTYQGARLGGSSAPFLGNSKESIPTGETPFMNYSAGDGMITGLRSESFSDMDALKCKEIRLLAHCVG